MLSDTWCLTHATRYLMLGTCYQITDAWYATRYQMPGTCYQIPDAWDAARYQPGTRNQIPDVWHATRYLMPNTCCQILDAWHMLLETCSLEHIAEQLLLSDSPRLSPFPRTNNPYEGGGGMPVTYVLKYCLRMLFLLYINIKKNIFWKVLIWGTEGPEK